MLRIALRSLVHEKGKFVAALWGVSFAAGLALAQTGLYVGFRAMATSVISRVGGDLWPLTPASPTRAASSSRGRRFASRAGGSTTSS
jgi:hypothetical protein